MLWIYWLIAIILALAFLALLAFLICTLFYILPMVKGAVYVPSKPEAIAAMLTLAKLKPGMKTVDLGCGDGRVVIAFAQAGAEAHGYEVNPLLVLRARRAIRAAKLNGRAFIHFKSYWDADLSSFDVVTVYGITYIMKDLRRKFKYELPGRAKIISNYFKLPNWPIKRTLSGVHLYLQA